MLIFEILRSRTDDSATEQPENTKLSPEESEFMDFCLELGQLCWQTFRESAFGSILTRVLPSDKVRLEANRLFQLGFGARLLFCPPRGPEALDRLFGPPVCEKAWLSYLDGAEGKTILDGAAYPDTPEPVLAVAKHFFKMGFEAGTIAARELMRESVKED